MDEKWGDREEKASCGARGIKGVNSLSKAQPTFYRNFLQNKATPVSRWVV